MMLCCIMEKQYFEELSVVKVLLEWKEIKFFVPFKKSQTEMSRDESRTSLLLEEDSQLLVN